MSTSQKDKDNEAGRRHHLIRILSVVALLLLVGIGVLSRISSRGMSAHAAPGSLNSPSSRNIAGQPLSTPLHNEITSQVTSSPSSHSSDLTVFVSSQNALDVIDAKSGKLRWSYPMQGNYSSIGQPVVVNGIVYLQNGYYLYAFNTGNGSLLWKLPISNGNENGFTPTVVNGVLYTAIDTTLYALDAKTGLQLWSYQTTPGIPGGVSTLMVVNGVLYAAVESDAKPTAYFYALNAFNGQFIWDYTSDAQAIETKAVGNGIFYGQISIFLGGESEDIYTCALNALNGKYLWCEEYTFVSLEKDMLYAYGDGVTALNAKNGVLIWQAPETFNSTMPVVVNGAIYGILDTTNSVYALNAKDGTLLWETPANDNLYTPLTPVVEYGIVYAEYGASHGSGIIFSFNATDGSELGYTAYPEYESDSFTIVNGMIYVSLLPEEANHQFLRQHIVLYKFKSAGGFNPYVWFYNVGISFYVDITIASF